MRVLGETRYQYEPDENGDDEYPMLGNIEKNQKDFDDDMTVMYIHDRIVELGIDRETKVRIIPSISGDGSDLNDGKRILSNNHYSMKRIEFVKEENTVYLHF
tara:strand:- start:113 stop:418 length:306 start_codon:yes stop_codon:yes gene_type:complete